MFRKKLVLVIAIAVVCVALGACSSKETQENTAEGAEEVQVVEEPTGETKQESSDSGFPEKMPEFSTIDLQGNVVTNDVFSQADLTVVNFWATYCSPCIGELPELGEWAKEMPDQVQMLGIVVDVEAEDSDQYELACQLADQTGASYQNLAAAGAFDEILYELVGVPTTFFVDGDGNIVGDPIAGADVDGYKAFVEEYLNE